MSIGGQEDRPFHLGTYQARAFCEQQRIELDAYHSCLNELTTGGLKSAVLVEALVWSALVAGAKLKKVPFEADADEVSFWIAEAPVDEIGKLFAVAIALNDTAPGNGPGQPAKAPKK